MNVSSLNPFEVAPRLLQPFKVRSDTCAAVLSQDGGSNRTLGDFTVLSEHLSTGGADGN